MVKVFYAPIGFKNTAEYLFKEALKDHNAVYPDYSRILYLTTGPAKLREAQKIFHRLVTNYCYIPPEILTINQLSKKLYSLYGDRRMLQRFLIPVIIARLSGKGLGFSTLVANLISEIKGRYPDKRIDEVRDIFSGIFDELNIPESVARLVLDCLDIFERYQKFIEEKGLVDEDDVIKNSCEFAVTSNESESSWFIAHSHEPSAMSHQPDLPLGTRYSLLILDGFFDPTVLEMNVLKALIQNSENTMVAIPYDLQFSGLMEGYISFLKAEFPIEEIYLKDSDEFAVTSNESKNSWFIAHSHEPSGISHQPDSSHATEPAVRLSAHDEDQRRSKGHSSLMVYHPYPDPEAEIEGIAGHIKSLYVSGRFRELERVVVTFPDLNKYAPIIERVFRRYGIPYCISRSIPLGRMKPFLDLFCLLASIEEDYPRLKFSQFLSSRYYSRIPDSLKRWIPTLSLQSGIISGKRSWLKFVSDGSETLDIKTMKEWVNIERDLKWVFKKIKPLEDIRHSATFDAYTGRLKIILEDLGFLDPSSDGMTEDTKKVFKEVLEHISFLGDIHPSQVTLSEFIEVLRHLLNSSFIDEERPGVRVMEFFDVFGLYPEYLYLGGLTDEAMPERQDIDHILPDSVKKKLGFLNLDKHIEIQRFIFNSIVKSSRHLHLSYPVMDGEDMFLPSSLLYSGEAVKEDIPGIFSKEEYLVRKGEGLFSRYIAEIEISPSIPKYSSGGILRVTDIDAYRACPRRFFIERVLGLSPLSVKEYEIEAITIGNIAHRVMEKIILESFKSLDSVRDRADVVLDDVMKESRIEGYWKELIKDTFMEILPAIYEKELEIRRGDYISTEVEKPVSGEPVRGIKLRGKIDRFDRIGDSIQIIDYKTGGAGLTCSQILKGNEDLQLFLYAAIMKSHGYKVDRVGIYSLKDINIKWCPSKKKGQGARGKDGSNLEDYIIASLRFLEDAVENIRKGDFSARPLNEYNCRNCHENPFCPYIQQ